jgi:hypothetical protein
VSLGAPLRYTIRRLSSSGYTEIQEYPTWTGHLKAQLRHSPEDGLEGGWGCGSYYMADFLEVI